MSVLAEGLFDMEPAAAWEAGDLVEVQTITGGLECTVVSAERRDGFPCLRVQPPDGEEFLVDVARVHRLRG